MPQLPPKKPSLSSASLIQQLQEVLAPKTTSNHHVANYLSAAELSEQLDISLCDKGCSELEIIEALQKYLHYTPKSQQPAYNKLLFSGRDAPAVLADWVTSLSNSTMHTYQVAPVASLMEQEIIKQINKLIGFNDGDGIMVSGGSMANMLAMMLARHRKNPSIKKQGFNGKALVAYVSELSHYSYSRGANVLGVGSENLISIKTDADGRLIPDDLEKAILHSISNEKQPFFIGLTAGTTVIGSFDPVKECSEIATKHGLWLHIDGAWGGPVLFSQTHRALLAASELADSFTWDAHKLLNIPLMASAILVKDKTILTECCAGGGEAYLFHEDENAAYNLGIKSLQCGRRVDSLKLWTSWKAAGSQGYAEKVDHLMSLKNTMLEKINQHADLELLAPVNFLNVLFRFSPAKRLSEDKLSNLNIALCQQLLKEDLCFVDYAEYKGKTGVRYVLANTELCESDITVFLDNCQKVGDKLLRKLLNQL